MQQKHCETSDDRRGDEAASRNKRISHVTYIQSIACRADVEKKYIHSSAIVQGTVVLRKLP